MATAFLWSGVGFINQFQTLLFFKENPHLVAIKDWAISPTGKFIITTGMMAGGIWLVYREVVRALTPDRVGLACPGCSLMSVHIPDGKFGPHFVGLQEHRAAIALFHCPMVFRAIHVRATIIYKAASDSRVFDEVRHGYWVGSHSPAARFRGNSTHHLVLAAQFSHRQHVEFYDDKRSDKGSPNIRRKQLPPGD
jgi:hypothetical protein